MDANKPVPVIIETPKGSTHKYDFDTDHQCFKLNKVMPAGMVFPYDFGFIPGTKGEDGDPLDVIVIAEFKTFTGCLMDCRIIGAILAKQVSAKENGRNDRYLAVPSLSSIFANVQTVDDLPAKILEEIQQFFINYNQQAGKKFTPIRIIKPKKALQLINKHKNG